MIDGIDICNLTKRYGVLTAVDDVSLSFVTTSFSRCLGPVWLRQDHVAALPRGV